MQPQRVDAIIDLAYGLLIFVAVVVMVLIGTRTGLAFGLGVLIAYLLHVGWKMARFDPEWMTESVEETVADEIEPVVDQVEELNERVDRRPNKSELEETIKDIQDEPEQ